MNTASEEADHEPERPTLWDRVRDWFATWTAVFTPDEILRDGLSRRFALRCCNWLWPLEATVRRLIIAAALAFDPAKLALPSPSRQPRKSEKSLLASPQTAGFSVVSVRGADASKVPAPIAKTIARKERHLPFPSDDLLRLGASRSQQGQKIVVRRDNPLRRQGRIQPSDPDYFPASEHDYANSSKLLFGSPEGSEHSPARDSNIRRAIHFRIPVESDDSEWRRIEKEWERVLPAPGIAARIIALAGVLDAPESHIRRLARRLATEPCLAALLRRTPSPLLRKPKHDHYGPQVDEDLTTLADAEMRGPDTS